MKISTFNYKNYLNYTEISNSHPLNRFKIQIYSKSKRQIYLFNSQYIPMCYKQNFSLLLCTLSVMLTIIHYYVCNSNYILLYPIAELFVEFLLHNFPCFLKFNNVAKLSSLFITQNRKILK